jgi:hypothetical protein
MPMNLLSVPRDDDSFCSEELKGLNGGQSGVEEGEMGFSMRVDIDITEFCSMLDSEGSHEHGCDGLETLARSASDDSQDSFFESLSDASHFQPAEAHLLPQLEAARVFMPLPPVPVPHIQSRNSERRKEAVKRWLEKRKRRVFSSTHTHYQQRREAAASRQRING